MIPEGILGRESPATAPDPCQGWRPHGIGGVTGGQRCGTTGDAGPRVRVLGWRVFRRPAPQFELRRSQALSRGGRAPLRRRVRAGADQRACRILTRRPAAPNPTPGRGSTVAPARPPNPYRVIAAEVRTAILNGILPAGTTLPPASSLAPATTWPPAPHTAPSLSSPRSSWSRSAAAAAPSSP